MAWKIRSVHILFRFIFVYIDTDRSNNGWDVWRRRRRVRFTYVYIAVKLLLIEAIPLPLSFVPLCSNVLCIRYEIWRVFLTLSSRASELSHFRPVNDLRTSRFPRTFIPDKQQMISYGCKNSVALKNLMSRTMGGSVLFDSHWLVSNIGLFLSMLVNKQILPCLWNPELVNISSCFKNGKRNSLFNKKVINLTRAKRNVRNSCRPFVIFI